MKAETTDAKAAVKEKAKAQRDAKGRFVKGNKGGPGNPFARQLGLLRATMVYCVPPERMARVVVALTDKAISGDVAAMKLFFQYLIGTPTEAVNPDRLPIDEWQKIRDGAVDPEEAAKVLERCPATLATDLVKEHWAGQAERNFQQALQEHAELEAQVAEDERYMEELEKAEEEALRRKAESAQPAPQPPSANGPKAEESSPRSSKQPRRADRPAPKQAKSEGRPSPNGPIGLENRNGWQDLARLMANAGKEEDGELVECIRDLIVPSPNMEMEERRELVNRIGELLRPSPNGQRTEADHPGI
jgi:hypothetical protein